MSKTKRVALSWDQEYVDSVKDLRSYLDRNLEKSASNWEVFFLCLSIGFSRKLKRLVPPRKSDSVRIEYLKDNHYMIFQAIALADADDYKVLLDQDKVFDIVESYAAGGLKFLADEMKSNPQFLIWLTSELYKKAKFVEGASS